MIEPYPSRIEALEEARKKAEEEEQKKAEEEAQRKAEEERAHGFGGGATVYVLDMSDTSIPLAEYARTIPSTCEEIGFTSSGNFDVFKTEAEAGFFSYGATIILK